MSGDAEFARAAAEFAARCGVAAQPLTVSELTEAEEDRRAGSDEAVGFVFAVPEGDVTSLLAEAQDDLFARGFYLFRGEPWRSIGPTARLVLWPTRDPYELLALMRTNGCNYGVWIDELAAWLRNLERDQPWILTGCGIDWMEGRFTTPVRHALALAERIYQFCPDVVDQATLTVEALADDTRQNQSFFLWWD